VKITKITHGQGETKNTGNYESLRVYNEVEALIEPGDTIKDIQIKLRTAVAKLNEKDFDNLLGA